ncbi:MAG: (d)CMP kinase [Verrucomicrobia bacterium]|nr:(d)CMP kinase [Verrucomicrobiota bacterium]
MSGKKFLVIAVDGGAASGKSSTSRGLAAKHNLMHVDTGAHYRTVALSLLRRGIKDADAFFAAENPLENLDLGTEVREREAAMSIGGTVPADAEIRNDAVNAVVSQFAAIPEVRKFLFDYQRLQKEVARERGFDGLIMDGRDIGSVIFPDADLRIFLTADPEARARRRAAEGIADSIAERDKLDSSRKAAPLACPEGAIKIDSTDLTLEQVVGKISGMISSL